MNLETLKLFLDIAALKSISKAANTAHITQSALSQQIKSWESSLGTELLQRSNKGAQLTESGLIAHKYAVQICKLYDEMMMEMEQQLKHGSHQLSIYAIPEVCNYALPCTMYEMKKQFPDYLITLNEGPSTLIEEQILMEEANIGFISGPSAHPELSSCKVLLDRVMLVSGSNTLRPDKIKLSELSRFPLIWSAQLSCVQRALNEIMEDKPKLNILYNLDSIEAVKLAAIKGHGAAFLPYMSIRRELRGKQLRIIHIDNFQVYNEIHLIKKKNQRCHHDTRQLIRYIEKSLPDTVC
ncbi:LysR family transcriptional regulator [Paenibacillus donghaensis]|uniref:LysR family transcriptional regulator n=1 Tax=Paenibacillus donghaensis TaxID=414771 RepID=UPI0018835C2F|nr:LysR family transcriptional regulator [Paenibacillus donghaensis]MBE9916346.1 LysR family transcriptional regulator [Paenibacillus donghaensis]